MALILRPRVVLLHRVRVPFQVDRSEDMTLRTRFMGRIRVIKEEQRVKDLSRSLPILVHRRTIHRLRARANIRRVLHHRPRLSPFQNGLFRADGAVLRMATPIIERIHRCVEDRRGAFRADLLRHVRDHLRVVNTLRAVIRAKRRV